MNNEVDNHDSFVEESRNEKAKKGWRKVFELVWSWMVYKDKDKWLEQMRGNLGLIATVISTMTFQIALNPPGGVRPLRENGDLVLDILECTRSKREPCPGEAVLGFTESAKYIDFLYWNTISFVASLSILLLLVSGIPLNNRFPMWLLSIGMCLTLTSLALTYITVLSMVTPYRVWEEAHNSQKILIYSWIGMLSFLALFLTLRTTVWGVKFFRKRDIKAFTLNIPRENTPSA